MIGPDYQRSATWGWRLAALFLGATLLLLAGPSSVFLLWAAFGALALTALQKWSEVK